MIPCNGIRPVPCTESKLISHFRWVCTGLATRLIRRTRQTRSSMRTSRSYVNIPWILHICITAKSPESAWEFNFPNRKVTITKPSEYNQRASNNKCVYLKSVVIDDGHAIQVDFIEINSLVNTTSATAVGFQLYF